MRRPLPGIAISRPDSFVARARRGTRRSALLACTLLGACAFDERAIAPGRPRIAVHAVLNPFGGLEYVVLVERTLTGRVATTDSAVDPADPIVSGGGSPVTGALVRIDEARGIEDVAVRTDGKGRGVYRFLNAPCTLFFCPPNAKAIGAGRTYVLAVDASGELVSGRTTVPRPRLRPDTAPVRILDREREMYTFSWNGEDAAFTTRFAVQFQTPYGPFELFTDRPSIAVTGDLRNAFIRSLPSVFVAGFRQPLQVLAVDRNYFDYYRSRNNPFTGAGLLTHLDGGTGVFGSVLPIRYTLVEVVAPIDEPGEGTWRREGDSTAFPTYLTIFYTGDLATGRVDDADSQPPRLQFLGTRTGPRHASRLTLHVLDAPSFLAASAASDTAYTLRAEARGDTLLVTRDGGPVERWRRAALPP